MYSIRKAELSDCALIRSLAERTFPYTYREILSPEQSDYMMEWMYSMESITRQMTQEGHVYFLLSDDGKPVGYVSVRPDGAEVCHLEKIYVLPECQGKHAGSALFDHVVDYVRQTWPSARALELNVNRYNPALQFYLHKGMHKDRQGDFDIGHGYFMNDYIMRLEL